MAGSVAIQGALSVLFRGIRTRQLKNLTEVEARFAEVHFEIRMQQPPITTGGTTEFQDTLLVLPVNIQVPLDGDLNACRAEATKLLADILGGLAESAQRLVTRLPENK